MAEFGATYHTEAVATLARMADVVVECTGAPRSSTSSPTPHTVVFGSVNANRRHYEAAAEALSRAPAGWPTRLITRRVPLESFADALERRPDDVKTVITFGD